MSLPRNLVLLSALLAATAPTAQPRDGRMRLIEPLRTEVFSNPWNRLRALEMVLGAEDSDESGFRLIGEDDLLEAFSYQTGAEDVPVYVKDFDALAANVLDILNHMDAGRDVYQYDLAWEPDWLIRREFRHLPDSPDGWLSLEEVCMLKGVSRRTARERMDRLYNGVKCYGGVWFVEPTPDFDMWLAAIPDWGTYSTRLRILQDVLHDNRPESFGTNEDLYAYLQDYEREAFDQSDVVAADPRMQSWSLGYYERYPVEKYLARHMALGTEFDGDIDASVSELLPPSPDMWARMLPGLIEHGEFMRTLQLDEIRATS